MVARYDHDLHVQEEVEKRKNGHVRLTEAKFMRRAIFLVSFSAIGKVVRCSRHELRLMQARRDK